MAVVEKDADHWENEFYGALEDFKFLPAGRITAGAGTARKVTLFNCFVMGTIPDSMGGIFDMLKEAALTMQAAELAMISVRYAQRRLGYRGCGGCIWAAFFHGCLGQYVPHNYVRGITPWCDDGDHAV